ncbi:GNAT family N-acetyltransferase [Tenacibaculum finnmarkense]|uniref:GNAT family N-acetyltransferase n=1 Tax=Tenacibaculum finnmarkense TaxID=2781243 RepID=UPI001EFB6D1E|nr:GNAT family N-acetyltransferase [Tenacibaculum finnmarkense]MCG8755547.1 GNAT family N-acetyltransferase [Tenacibaculum finnmarkense]MCG8784136.1 GNAT family N-acetyltransferase [Tenacibaculum finnmarkense]
MGKVFLLQKTEFTNDLQIPSNYILKKLLNEKEATEFLVIQEQISKEITEEIGVLHKEYLTKKNKYHPNGLIFCISKNDNDECVGYGYGNIDYDNRNFFYINTIGVRYDYRKKGIGTKIKIALIGKAFENPQITCIKAITQIDNLITLKINEKLGFNGIETNEMEK